jgi:hypothetical protein
MEAEKIGRKYGINTEKNHYFMRCALCAKRW